MTADPAVRVRNLTIAFGDFKAVDDISFEVQKGEIFGFLGANGAGKTTTIRALCGLLLPTSGEITVAGLDIKSGLRGIKTKVGYMSQKFTLYPTLTVRQNMAFAGALRKMAPSHINARAKELFKFTGFDGPQDSPVKTLPGGIKQVVALCACLLPDPEIIFLDEPTAGVSPSSRVLFWRLINSVAQNGKTVFVTTHYMDEAEQCARITLMQSGKIIALDTPQNLKDKNFPTPLFEVEPNKKAGADFGEKLANCGAGNVSPCGLMYHIEITNEAAWAGFQTAMPGAFSFRPIKPTLEDVFLKLVGGGEK